MKKYAIIEIGSNNTKTHIYEDDNLLYNKTCTIEFKKNYQDEGTILKTDLELLYKEIKKALEYTDDIHIYGCSIFRKISDTELSEINEEMMSLFNLKIEVVSQEDEAKYTAIGCYSDISYDGVMCVFIGGGGSIELLFVKNKEIIDKKYYNFGVVDITKTYPSLKDDVPSVSLAEVCSYVDKLIGEINTNADILILAGGDHLYWYNIAGYELEENTLYKSDKQKYMLDIKKSDAYDNDALVTSLDAIRNKSDNPLWFDGARAMKVITNVLSHKINAKYIVPTSINMEDGIRAYLNNL